MKNNQLKKPQQKKAKIKKIKKKSKEPRKYKQNKLIMQITPIQISQIKNDI